MMHAKATLHLLILPAGFSPSESWGARGSDPNTWFLLLDIIPSNGSAPQLTGTDRGENFDSLQRSGLILAQNLLHRLVHLNSMPMTQF
jgi:hypothetical protein